MRTEEMGVFADSDRGMWTAASLLTLLSTALLFSSCRLFDPQTPAAPVNDVVALVADDSGSATAGVHVFYNDGHGNLSVGPVLQGSFNNTTVSSGYTDLALGNISGHSAASGGGSSTDGVFSPVNDIFVTNDNVGPNEVWINDGSGNFTQDTHMPTGLYYSMAVVLGPIMGHGVPDAFIVNDGSAAYAKSGTGQSAIVLANSTSNPGAFTQATEANLELGTLPQDDGTAAATGNLGSGDAQDSGNLTDIFQANDGGTNRMWLNYGGNYQNATALAATNDSAGVAIGDLDGNGTDDVFVANDGQANVVMTQSASGTFTTLSEPAFSASSPSTAVALGDLNGDGILDAFVVNNGVPDTVWSNNGHGTFSEINEPQFSGMTDQGTAVTLADINGDGILDAIVASGGPDGTIKVWLGTGNGTFKELSEPNIPPGNYVAVAAGRLR